MRQAGTRTHLRFWQTACRQPPEFQKVKDQLHKGGSCWAAGSSCGPGDLKLEKTSRGGKHGDLGGAAHTKVFCLGRHAPFCPLLWLLITSLGSPQDSPQSFFPWSLHPKTRRATFFDVTLPPMLRYLIDSLLLPYHVAATLHDLVNTLWGLQNHWLEGVSMVLELEKKFCFKTKATQSQKWK